MGRSKGTIISVKVPIKWASMTDRQKTRLNRITGRDSRVIKGYLGVTWVFCRSNPKRRFITNSQFGLKIGTVYTDYNLSGDE